MAWHLLLVIHCHMYTMHLSVAVVAIVFVGVAIFCCPPPRKLGVSVLQCRVTLLIQQLLLLF